MDDNSLSKLAVQYKPKQQTQTDENEKRLQPNL
jgi:hypothetical protein